jgi:hypothetical protein
MKKERVHEDTEGKRFWKSEEMEVKDKGET